MATKRSVILRGSPTINEVGKASATVKPGYLVKGVTTVAHQDADGGAPVAKAFALERDEFGVGIDDTYKGSGSISAFYASGDQVKVGVFRPGDQITGFVASGENVSEDTILTSAGDGTLEVLGSYTSGSGPDYPIARSLETLGAAHDVIACKIEIL